MTPNTIPAKLLLFGEYTVLHGGRALAVPETRWSGQLGMSGDGKRSDELQTWADDIASRMLWPKATMDQFRRDIDAGLSFASNIPLGYGLGSSGALCAAVYKTYRNTGDSIEVMRRELAEMESFFHGTSSGMDPLVSLLRTPILREGDLFHRLNLDAVRNDPSAPVIFLLDSGQPRSTEQLVAQFSRRRAEAEFDRRILAPLTEASDHAIACYLDQQWDMFWQFLTLISTIQITHLTEFIPTAIQAVWGKRDDICLKLCGAGGGGFFLGFAKNRAALDQIRDMEGVTPV